MTIITMPHVTEATITEIVLERWKAVPDPRLREIMQSMISHLHAFVRDIEPTEQEWMMAIEWLTRTGKLSNDKRQEFILASDVVGVSMLVDCINHRLSGEATPTTVTGPFHVHDSPRLPDGADMATGITTRSMAAMNPGCAASSNRMPTGISWSRPCFRCLIRFPWMAVSGRS